jgi:hypothetical protein
LAKLAVDLGLTPSESYGGVALAISAPTTMTVTSTASMAFPVFSITSL